MPYLCQVLQMQTDICYSGYWRVLVFRVEWNGGGRLRWRLHKRFGWNERKKNARADLLPNVPQFKVANNDYVTKKQAARLTGIPSPMCMDYLMEQEHPYPDPHYGLTREQIAALEAAEGDVDG